MDRNEVEKLSVSELNRYISKLCFNIVSGAHHMEWQRVVNAKIDLDMLLEVWQDLEVHSESEESEEEGKHYKKALEEYKLQAIANGDTVWLGELQSKLETLKKIEQDKIRNRIEEYLTNTS